MEVDKKLLTFEGSMNYIVQVWWDEHEPDVCGVDIYHPRRNDVWTGEVSKEEADEKIRETMERMKIAITQFQEFLDGKRDSVYYWQLDDE